MKKNKAFTLIEMLVVVVIIGIVLTLVLPNVTGLLNNKSKKQYNTHMKVLEKAVGLYLDQYKGELANHDDTCFNINYDTLLIDNLIKEDQISCKGNIIVTKAGNNRNYTHDYYLTCVDKNNETLSTKGTVPKGCLGFNGKFKMEYSIYEDNNKTKSYNGSYYVKNAYPYFYSESPYDLKITGYEYTINLDGTWKSITSGVNLGSLTDTKNLEGNLYVRAIDEDGNRSSVVSIPVKMDNTGPSFKTNVTGSYLTKTLKISNVVDDKVGTLASKPYSFDGGVTWDNNLTKDYTENKTVSVCVKDVFENRTCKEVKITGVDRTYPVIVANSTKAYITEGLSKSISDFYKVTYSSIGGSEVCKLGDKVITNINQLEVGLNTLTCTATSKNTLTDTVELVIAHQYNATVNCNGGRTVSGANCTYYYSNNQGKCGCKTWNQTCKEYNQTCLEFHKKCQTYEQKCQEWEKVCTAYNQVCVQANYCQSSACGPCINKYYDCGVAGGSADYCPTGYQWVDWPTGKCCKQGCFYQSCYSEVGCGCASYTNGTECIGGWVQTSNCTGGWVNTNNCLNEVDDTSRCKTWQNTTCKTWQNTTCQTANSCDAVENEYRYYTCPGISGVNGNTGKTITPAVDGAYCRF